MAATFDPALSTDKDVVRLLIGDTNMSNAYFQDETIEGILAREMNPYMAGAELSMYLARKLTGGGVLEDRKVGETRIRYRRAADLKLQADELRTRGKTYQKPSGGGIYTSETDEYNKDTSLDKPELAKKMTDHPGVPDLTNKTTGVSTSS